MKKIDLSKLSEQELQQKVADFKTQMENLRLSHKMSPIENPMRIAVLRKTIARYCTELTKRQHAA
ncbi:MAG: 50S ribosomal protein L29 [Bacteroidetes bacterium]|nr:50S ribosomal protein L29 [Bacteroidota bacterium]MBM3425098.1 50S ribosomal protein L29 [Bacteroidota bacterium]